MSGTEGFVERRHGQRRRSPIRRTPVPISLPRDPGGPGCYEVSFAFERPGGMPMRGRYLVVAPDTEVAVRRAQAIAGRGHFRVFRVRRLHANAEHMAGGYLSGSPFGTEIQRAAARGRIDAELDGELGPPVGRAGIA